MTEVLKNKKTVVVQLESETFNLKDLRQFLARGGKLNSHPSVKKRFKKQLIKL